MATVNASYDVDGLITDASIDLAGESLLLLGYKNNGANFYSSFIWMFWDYNGNDFFSGNKRRIEIGTMLTLGQTEGIALKGSSSGFVSSEQISSIITIPPKLMQFDFSDYLNDEVAGTISSVKYNRLLYPNPCRQSLNIEGNDERFRIYNLETSKLVLNGVVRLNQVDISSLHPGVFYIQVCKSKMKFTKQE